MYAFDEFFTLEFEPYPLPILAFWDEAARRYYRSKPDALLKDEYSRLNARSLVLLNWKDDFYQADLERLWKTGAGVLAHVPAGIPRDPGIVINNIQAQMQDCCTTGGALDPEKRFGLSPSAKDRLNRIMLGTPQIYNQIVLTRPDRSVVSNPRTVFVASPYDPKLYDPFFEGVTAAMNAVKIVVVNPRDASGTSHIGEKVRKSIDGCDFLIANLRNRIRRYEWSRNANVWYEIGYAWKCNIPVLFWCHEADRFRMPADLDGYECLTYCDPIHLALQLFYGFGGHEIPRIP